MLGVNQLNGFGAYQSAAASGPITSLTYIDHTTSTADTINCPASVNAGDLLVLIQRARSAATVPTLVTPADFTTVNNLGINQISVEICYKIADGTEDGASRTGTNGDADDGKVMFQYRANAPLTSVTAANWGAANTSSNPVARTISASAGTGIVLGITAFACNSSLGSVDPRTTSITPDHEVNPSTAFYVHDYIQASSPVDYTFDMDDEGNNNTLWGCYFHNMQT